VKYNLQKPVKSVAGFRVIVNGVKLGNRVGHNFVI